MSAELRLHHNQSWGTLEWFPRALTNLLGKSFSQVPVLGASFPQLPSLWQCSPSRSAMHMGLLSGWWGRWPMFVASRNRVHADPSPAHSTHHQYRVSISTPYHSLAQTPKAPQPKLWWSFLLPCPQDNVFPPAHRWLALLSFLHDLSFLPPDPTQPTQSPHHTCTPWGSRKALLRKSQSSTDLSCSATALIPPCGDAVPTSNAERSRGSIATHRGTDLQKRYRCSPCRQKPWKWHLLGHLPRQLMKFLRIFFF